MSRVYSIKDLEKLSGVKAHTLRIWEKRYSIVSPKRNCNNVRYYLDEDLKFILDVSFLNRHGLKISKIAQMSKQDISDAIFKYSDKEVDPKDIVDALCIAILELDGLKCNKLLQNNIDQIGMEKSMYNLIYPLLDRLSMMWISGSLKSVHEAFIRNILRIKVSAEIDKIDFKAKKGQKKFLIYLPEGEQHELSLLFLHFMLKNKNAEVVNLGLNVSVDDLIQGCKIIEPDYTFTIINDSFVVESLQSYIDFLSNHIQNTVLLFSGFQFVKQDITLNEKTKFIKNLKDIENYIQ